MSKSSEPKARAPQEPAAQTYCCERCKQTVTLFIKASVTCSRCGKEMRQVNRGDSH